ncbi:MAG: peptide chain release factor 2 [Chlamydiia bacterium]|nr:peptide chain release factor 2 [Chlamydiia bacterium]
MELMFLKKFIEEHRKKHALFHSALEISKLSERIKDIDEYMANITEWNSREVNKMQIERSQNKSSLNKINGYGSLIQDLDSVLELLQISNDEDLSKESDILSNEITKVHDEIEVMYLLSDELDICSCFLRISAGAGGNDACDWTEILSGMYSKWSLSKGFSLETSDSLPGESAGYRYIVYKIEGEYAYGLLKNETGIHRLVRKSEFNAQNKRHTSFASVYVTPIVEIESVKINEKDLDIHTCRSSGAGGQHVNTTDSKVRIVHLPTGIAMTCQKERSQAKNKETAMQMLISKLSCMRKEERDNKVESASGDKKDVSWGNQCRNYVMDPYKLVKDTRTGFESRNMQAMLNGSILDEFIKAVLIMKIQ